LVPIALLALNAWFQALQQRVTARFETDRLWVMMYSPVPERVCLAGAGMDKMDVDMTKSLRGMNSSARFHCAQKWGNNLQEKALWNVGVTPGGG
jgi:hypothetical protein